MRRAYLFVSPSPRLVRMTHDSTTSADTPTATDSAEVSKPSQPVPRPIVIPYGGTSIPGEDVWRPQDYRPALSR